MCQPTELGVLNIKIYRRCLLLLMDFYKKDAALLYASAVSSGIIIVMGYNKGMVFIHKMVQTRKESKKTIYLSNI